MTTKRAIEVLTEYNKWRRHEGEPCDCKYSAMEVGAAIDVAIHSMWQMEKIQELVYFGKGTGDERNQGKMGSGHC